MDIFNHSNLWYYIGLYLLVFCIRICKIFTFNIFKQSNVKKKRGYVHISLEIVYSASGFVILLLQKLNPSMAPIIIFYLIFVIFSTALDFVDEEHQNWKTMVSNLVIISLIFALTIYFLGSKIPELEAQNDESNYEDQSIDTLKYFKIMIPFTDNSLKKHIGPDKYGNRNFVFITQVKSKNDSLALMSAYNNFELDELTKPIYPIIEGSSLPMIKIDTNNILVHKLRIKKHL